ncbi:NAD(P)-binding oxidoreductase [Cohnella nanjingensis]|uniref:SDR family oxidoreductase n=1 Tax=Cohnella nanjingensis TaxID=1387779 RepID=A0A7X0VF89_9BACL|nr:NAD(P)-binding oxidoreductase [Cohnella nanjingensis]MBB6671800.1 SDR family oxidoreductase [Cohnella nanjingensis]
MKIVVLGASGTTGRQVVWELINRNIHTRVLIRKTAVLDPDIEKSSFVEIVKGNISELDRSELNQLLSDCSVVISCLGHTPTLKGMFGKPRDLVSDAVKKVSETVKRSEHKIKLILMSTTGYTNHSEGESHSWGERVLFSVLSLLLPPHRDNVMAADYLVDDLGKEDENISWIAVRPDTLVNDDEVSPYEVTSSLVRSPLFNQGKTSRRNVGHFMAELATDPLLWKRWVCKMPVIYNK